MRYAAVGASLAERGLLSLDVAVTAAAIVALAAGLAIGRARAVLAAPLLVGLVFAGVAAGWWADGFAPGWPAVFLVWTAAAALLAGAGVAVARLLRAHLPVSGRPWRGGVAVAALVAVALAWLVFTRPADVRLPEPAPVYYLGESFEGYRLTHAEVGGGRALLVYGDCEHPVGRADGGCTAPIQLQQEYPLAGDEPRPPTCPAPGRPRPAATPRRSCSPARR